MIDAAREVLKNAYSPYSKYRVAAAVLDERGRVSVGCNVENASYGATVCAERVAIFNAVAHGAKRIEAVVIMTESKKPWPPCGMCRQVLLEFADLKTPVLLKSTKGPSKQLKLKALCPLQFSPAQMKNK